jgi:RNA polymerase sigma-70 factor (ECF subfamily)
VSPPAAGAADRGAGWALIEAAQAGDRDAFGQLYARYASGVSRFIGSRTRDLALAQDLTSETFARALRRIDSVTDQGRDVGAWFTTIARNLVLDHVKSHRYQRETPTAEITDARPDQDTPEQAVIRREAAADVRRRVGQLPTDQQECIRLRFFNELSVAETAAAMGRNEGAVKALQHRGVLGLRASMAKDAHAPAPPRDAVPDPLARARRAVAEVTQQVTDTDPGRVESDRAQQLARWHADDQTAAAHRGIDRSWPAVAAGGGVS